MKLHPIEFPIEERRLLRGVVTAIEQIENQYPGVTPHSVMTEYKKVREFYARQLADEEYVMTTFHNPVMPD